MANFTRKHFQATADIVKDINDVQEREVVAKRFAKLFAEQNPRFDRGRFLNACELHVTKLRLG